MNIIQFLLICSFTFSLPTIASSSSAQPQPQSSEQHEKLARSPRLQPVIVAFTRSRTENEKCLADNNMSTQELEKLVIPLYNAQNIDNAQTQIVAQYNLQPVVRAMHQLNSAMHTFMTTHPGVNTEDIKAATTIALSKLNEEPCSKRQRKD